MCSEAKILCDYCQVDFPRRVLPAHVDACGSRTEECEGCGERVMLREMEAHVCRPRQDLISSHIIFVIVSRHLQC